MKPVFNERTPRFKTSEEKSFKRDDRKNDRPSNRNAKGKTLSLGRSARDVQPENIYPTEARKANG